MNQERTKEQYANTCTMYYVIPLDSREVGPILELLNFLTQTPPLVLMTPYHGSLECNQHENAPRILSGFIFRPWEHGVAESL